MADPLTFTSLAAVPGYSLPLLAVQWRTAAAATLAFAPLLTAHGNMSHWPRLLLLVGVYKCITAVSENA